MNNQFRDFPWTKVDSDEIHAIPAFTFLEERQLALWLAKEQYSGHGEIVDAGAFLGGSALSLSIGLHQNLRVPQTEKMGRVHAYDLFLWAPWMNDRYLPPDVKFGTSFLNRFHDTIKNTKISLSSILGILQIVSGDLGRSRSWI